MKKLLFLTILTVMTSCAHTFMRGTIVKKLNSKDIVVCLGSNQVKVGDLVKFERSECSGSIDNNTNMHENNSLGSSFDYADHGLEQCELIYLGRGKVIKLINDHFSIIRSTSEIRSNESTHVEVINK